MAVQQYQRQIVMLIIIIIISRARSRIIFRGVPGSNLGYITSIKFKVFHDFPLHLLANAWDLPINRQPPNNSNHFQAHLLLLRFDHVPFHTAFTVEIETANYIQGGQTFLIEVAEEIKSKERKHLRVN
jgi:hypothetical protein